MDVEQHRGMKANFQKGKEKVGGKGKQISLFSAVCTDIERYVGTNVPESFE